LCFLFISDNDHRKKKLYKEKEMKTFVFAVATLASTLAFAHGSTAHQASEAISSAVKLFSAQPKDVQRQFLSVAAVQTGHEQFDVAITLKDQTTQFHFACAENEDVDPVVWECAAK
jgi:hypothetical protein